VTSLGPVLAADGLVLELDGHGRVPVCGDEQRLWQLAANLVENARRATAAGGTVRVLVHRDGAGAELVVEDTGRGIEAAALTRIFAPFEQAGSTGHGLGLGLTIARHLAERHGGTLTATSEVGVGSRFVACFPDAHLHPTSWSPLR
jgi:signal transduction histidine kinase